MLELPSLPHAGIHAGSDSVVHAARAESAKTSASSIVSKLPIFPPFASHSLSLSVSAPPSSLPLSFLSASARPSDLQSRPRLPSCRSHRRVLHRSRSGAFHGRSACPELFLDQRETALSNSKQITEDGNCSVLIYAFRLRPQPFTGLGRWL